MAMKDMLVVIAMSGMQTAGNILTSKDANNTGTDDVVGNLFKVGSNAAAKYVAGDINGLNSSLKTIRDSIDEYLATQS